MLGRADSHYGQPEPTVARERKPTQRGQAATISPKVNMKGHMSGLGGAVAIIGTGTIKFGENFHQSFTDMSGGRELRRH